MNNVLNRVGGWKNYVPTPDGMRDVIKKKYVTTDIQTLIIYGDAYNGERRFVKDIAPLLRGRNQIETCKNVWDFVKLNVKYIKDDLNNDKVKTANVTLFDGYGDCKSMTLLTGAILRELGIPYKIRFASYDGTNRVSHVYLIALADGKDTIIDAVYWYFNQEITFSYFEDYYVFGSRYKPNMEKSGVNGIVKPNATGVGKILLFSFLALTLYAWQQGKD